MFTQCRNYLTDLLTASGVKRSIHINQKTLDADKESHKGAVIPEADESVRSGQKTNYMDNQGLKHRRTKVYDRKITFIVTIGDHTDEAVETIYEAFLRGCGAGLYDADGNWIRISLQPASWWDEKDQIINSKVAVVFKVTFEGGIYEDTDYINVAIEQQTPEME